MNENLKAQKNLMREQAKRTRGVLNSLDSQQQKKLGQNFFDNIEVSEDVCVASYWSVDRELDTSILMDELLDRGVKVALPIVEKGSRFLNFAQWKADTPMSIGAYNIPQPEIDEKTVWLEPDIFLVPMLAFDRRGNRLGYGGGYYDFTLAEYRNKKNVLAVGLAYAEQACLFNLPTEEHDQKMDWIITEQSIVHL
jgi:5-formyltetrahydrofolate cyclo-ligase